MYAPNTDTNYQVNSQFDEVAKELELFKPRINVVGVGGGGNNTVQRLSMMDIKGAGLFAFNTDLKQLNILNPNINKLILGKEITHGLGTGGYPEVGAKSAEMSGHEITEMIKGTNLMFLCAGLGGGTGTGAAPVVAQIAKEAGAIVIGIVTLPFSLERVRLDTAKKGLEKLRQNVDTLIVIDNQKLVSLYPNMGIEKAFTLADEITARAVRGITETITQPSLISLDFADVKSIMSVGGWSMISVGIGSPPDLVTKVVEDTLKNKLLDVDYSGATGVLLHITGGPEVTLGEATEIAEKLTSTAAPNANVILGARLDPMYIGKVEVIAIFTGVSGPSFSDRPHGERKEKDSGFGIYEI